MTEVDDLVSAHDPAIAVLSRTTIGLVTDLTVPVACTGT